MAQILIKHGVQANVSSMTLAIGEFALAIDTGNVYIGTSLGKVLVNIPGGVSDKAKQLETERNFSITGDGTAVPMPFNGTQNVPLAFVLATIAGLTAGTYPKVTINSKGQVISGGNLTVTDIPTLTLSKISDAGTAASKNTGIASGQIPILNASGKLDDSIIPALSINDIFVVSNQAAMLALTAETGDMAVRTDLNQTYVLQKPPASTLTNWIVLPTPTGAITSINGKSGTTITLTPSDIGAEPVISIKNTAFNVPFESTIANIKMDGIQNLGALGTVPRADHIHPSDTTKASSANPAFTGVPIAPTATLHTNTTQIATTAFVINELAIIDGGTF